VLIVVQQALIQVYTGEGKGKTTAATGLAVRALGQGLRVLLVRFLKPAEPVTGEVALLQNFPGIDILTSGIGVVGRRPDRDEIVRSVTQTFEAACARTPGNYDLVIFDEINNSLHRGYLPLATFLEYLDHRPEGVELVLTGRNAPPEVIARADLVTRMEKIRHPFDLGIAARRGIEF
jgi:cob(I)alamin adenosyltransferase